MGYGVLKMTARTRGVFLDIRATRQNAQFFYIFGGLWSKRPEYIDILRSLQQVV